MILEEKLKQELERKEILQETQAGFRAGRRTMDNLYILNRTVDKELEKKGGKVYAFFIDLRAAFDTINRKKLIEVMKKNGITEQLVKAVEEIYKDTRCAVRVNGEMTKNLEQKRG